MNIRIFAAVATSILVGLAFSSPTSAKTKAECTKEWQANKVANQAAGKTEKAYLVECRGVAASAKSAAPAAPVEKDRTSGRY
jgi:hypothetical protein